MAKTTVGKGKEFENQVAELYRLMGYEIKQNIGVLGHQIDIILTYTMPGGVKVDTAVECKYIEKGDLKKNDIMENINALVDLKRNDIVQNLIIVTTNGFAKDVWDTAQANKIQLLTIPNLKHQILKLDQYLDRIIKDFENDEISKYYIKLFAQDDEKIPKKVFDVQEYLNKWINDEDINHVSILGEYGTGKTSFCRKFAHDLAVRYNKDPLNNRIPILINLRDYYKAMSVRQLITDLLINEYGLRGIDFPLFEKMNDEGLFLLIFDGFDEMAQKVIFDVAYSNYTKIAELAKPGKSKVILTCRTEFFRTHDKEKEILLDIDRRKNFDIIYLRGFDDEQIKEFLQKRVLLIEADKKKKQGWKYYYQKIQGVFDLRDLAKRPVLLDLIAKYLPQLIEKEEKINASSLYLTTIHEELKRRLISGKTIIQRDDRIKLMKLLALWMYTNDKLFVYYEDITELLNLKAHFDLKTRTDIEYHLNDFLTCSFLNRDTNGNYRFSHKSFVDFLVAWKFADDIENDRRYDIAKKKITYEIIQFIKDFEIKRDRLYQWIESTKEKTFSESQYIGGNAVDILNELGEDFTKRNFNFSETILDHADFSNQDLTGLNFQKTSLKYGKFNNTILNKTDFSFADLEGVNFEESGKVFSVAWSPDGKYIASGGDDTFLKIWDAKTHKEIMILRGYNEAIYNIAFNPKRDIVAYCGVFGTVFIYDFDKNETKNLNLQGRSMDFSYCGKFLVIAGGENGVIIYDIDNAKIFRKFTFLKKIVNTVAYSPNGEYVVSDWDRSVKVWDINNNKELITFRGHEKPVRSVTFDPLGKYIISGSSDIRLWDMKGNLVMIYKGYVDFSQLVLSPDGKCIAEGDDDLKIWDAKPDSETFGQCLKTFKGHSDIVNKIAYSPDGKFLVSGSNDKTIKIWDADQVSLDFGKCLHTIRQQINCNEMNIKGIKGLNKERIKFLFERGAIGGEN